MSEDKSLEENFETANARITPGVTISGMGEVSLPNSENGNIGSGDVPDVADIDDDEEEAKKDKTKKKLEMEGFKLFTQFDNFVTEGKFDDIGDLVKSLHFEMDPKTAEEKKIELGKRQGEVVPRKQIEGGNYSIRRFRKEIGYWDGNKKDQEWAEGVFAGPDHYNTVKSTLGAGPHKKAAKKVKWNQRKYDQWLEDVASNDGWKNAFDMAQNAKFEPGLIDWVKKNNRGEDVMQRIQWDIEAFAESVVTEKLARGLKPLLTIGSTLKKNVGEDALLDLSDKFDRIDDEYAGTIASWLDMAIELMQDGYGKSATEKLKQFNKACKDVLAGKEIGSAFESVTKDYFSEYCKLNEAKSINRDEMMDWIGKYMKFVGTSEEFDGSEGGIHLSGEDGAEYKGAIIYSYYSEDYKNREFGVWNKWEKELNKRGWYSEWYDAGTVCVWPL